MSRELTRYIEFNPFAGGAVHTCSDGWGRAYSFRLLDGAWYYQGPEQGLAWYPVENLDGSPDDALVYCEA